MGDTKEKEKKNTWINDIDRDMERQFMKKCVQTGWCLILAANWQIHFRCMQKCIAYALCTVPCACCAIDHWPKWTILIKCEESRDDCVHPNILYFYTGYLFIVVSHAFATLLIIHWPPRCSKMLFVVWFSGISIDHMFMACFPIPIDPRVPEQEREREERGAYEKEKKHNDSQNKWNWIASPSLVAPTQFR